jgi:tryptophan synthase alpha subunit
MAAATAAAAQPTPRSPIIDVHLHTHAAGRFGRVGLPNPVTSKPSAATTDDALLRAALAEMRRLNIVAAFGFSSRNSTERWRNAADGRIIGGIQIDQGLPMPELAQLRADIVAGRVRMIGEVGAQ